MSDDFDFVDDNENETASTKSGKGLRAQLETALAELNTLKEANAKYEAAHRSVSVKGILKAKGIPESAAKFYNDEDVSEGAVSKWIEENSEIFGAPSETAESSNETDENALSAQRVTAASFGNAQSIQNSGTGAIKGDPVEMLRLMQTLPYEELRKLGYAAPAGSSAFSKK